MRINSVRVQESMSRTTAFLNDILGSSMVFKAFSMERRLQKQYVGYSEDIALGEKKKARIEGATGAISSLLGNLTFLLALVIAGWFVANGRLEVGAMIAFIQLMNYLVGPFSSLPGLVASMQQSLGAAERIFEVMDAPAEVEVLPEVRAELPGFGELRLAEVSFSYPGSEKQSLNKVSLELARGQQMAVVGPSGGGNPPCSSCCLVSIRRMRVRLRSTAVRSAEYRLQSCGATSPMCLRSRDCIPGASGTILRAASPVRQTKRLSRRCGRRMRTSS